MVADNGKYVLSKTLAEVVAFLPLSAPTLRVLHALLHWQHTYVEWRPEFVNDPDAASTWCRVADLRASLDMRSRDARTLRRAVEELSSRGIFDFILLSENNRNLRWCFSSNVHELMLERTDRYALLDIDCIRACRTPAELMIYVLTAQVWQMRYPEFFLYSESLRQDPSSDAQLIDWRRERRRLCPAFIHVAGLLGAEFVLRLLQDQRRPGIGKVSVRLRHPSARWRRPQLFAAPPGTVFYRVDTGGCRRAERPNGPTAGPASCDVVKNQG